LERQLGIDLSAAKKLGAAAQNASAPNDLGQAQSTMGVIVLGARRARVRKCRPHH
jgi:hypothetical protein